MSKSRNYEIIAVYPVEIAGQLVLVKRYASVVSPDAVEQFEDARLPEVDPVHLEGYVDEDPNLVSTSEDE